jgi:hypothetical protein
MAPSLTAKMSTVEPLFKGLATTDTTTSRGFSFDAEQTRMPGFSKLE